MPWHTEPSQDLDARRQMINLIANFLEKRHPKTSQVQDALVATARKLEVALYKACKTKQEYMETRSLALRIRELERTGNFSLDVALGPTAPVQAAPPPAAAPVQAPVVAAATTTPVAVVPASKLAAPTPTTHAEVLKQRRNRLLLLKHASKCAEEDGKCANAWCPQMKKLWAHVSACKVPECNYAHCVSSHYVLTHYHRCRDPLCPVCGPVRDAAARKRLEMSLDKAGNMPASETKQQTIANPNTPRATEQDQNSSANANAKTVANASVQNRIVKEFARGSREGSKPALALSMTKQAVQHHLDSLKVEQLQQAFFPVLRKLMENTKLNGGIFNHPVDEKDAPGYYKVINKPMDLGTVRRRLDDGKYRRIEDFEAEVNLVFNNATLFNPKQHRVHNSAIDLKNIFETEVRKIKQKFTDHSTVQKKGGKCPLCNETQCAQCVLCERGCIAYEPKILFCAGGCEQNSRIPRNATFFSLPGSSLNWCSDCHDRRKNETFVIDVSTGNNYNKTDLVKRKHDELFGEPWVGCDSCEGWCHQTCALFNARKQPPPSKQGGRDDTFLCPKCLVKTDYTPSVKVPGAEDLEHTRLSKFLEMWVRGKLGDALQQEKLNTTKPRGEDPPPANAVSIQIGRAHV